MLHALRIAATALIPVVLAASTAIADNTPSWIQPSNCTVDIQDVAAQSSFGQPAEVTVEFWRLHTIAATRFAQISSDDYPVSCVARRNSIEFIYSSHPTYDAYWHVFYSVPYGVFHAQHVVVHGTWAEQPEYCFNQSENATTRTELARLPTAKQASSRCHQYFRAVDAARGN